MTPSGGAAELRPQWQLHRRGGGDSPRTDDGLTPLPAQVNAEGGRRAGAVLDGALAEPPRALAD